jgi:predicted MPP superfamily phosphohydrolase
MKLMWLTDVHLNFLDDQAREEFYQRLLTAECDGLLLSGDIAEALDIVSILTEMAHYISKPIYFVLGNHDYYRGEVDVIRTQMKTLTETNINLFWLPASGVQVLNDNTVLVGQDGWADGRFGDYQNSRVELNDSRMIVDLFQAKILGKQQLLEKMQQLADVDAQQMQDNVSQALARHPKQIIILTHIPPFKESCMHLGHISDDQWLPFFSSKVMGDVLLHAAIENPATAFLVLCGHTHSVALYQPLPNLTVKTGSAEYFHPDLQQVIDI